MLSPADTGGFLDRRIVLSHCAQGCRRGAGGRLSLPSKHPGTDHGRRYRKGNQNLTHTVPPQIENISPNTFERLKKNTATL
jgi:hypothetical protein